MIKEFYRGYRGVATKYINRYAALFSFIWKFRKLKDNDLHGKIKAMVDKSGFAIRTGKLNVTKSQIRDKLMSSW